MPAPVLEVRRLGVAYDGGVVLRDVSFAIAPGEALAVVGANGSGKSSLCRALAGLVQASGEIRLDGRPVIGLRVEERARQGLVLVPQDSGTFAGLTVRDNLALAAGRQPRRQRAVATEAMLARFPQLRGRLWQRAGVLSGGEQKQLSLARALLLQPRLLVLDEPTAGLAPETAAEVATFLRRLRGDTGLPMLVIEHDAGVVPVVADRLLRLSAGVLAEASC